MTMRLNLPTGFSVPSPLVGEGQGGGWPQATTSRFSGGVAATLLFHQLWRIPNRWRRDSRLPLSPALPHKGGGSDTDSRLGHRTTTQSNPA
jgi:hypothetical protein